MLNMYDHISYLLFKENALDFEIRWMGREAISGLEG